MSAEILTRNLEKAMRRRVDQFIDDNDIWCKETIYQTDRVIVNAYDFIADLCDIAGYKRDED